MTINKLVFPAEENAVQGKINEIIDDKQDLLVSGTNIKTVNSTSLLGSGNIDTNDIFIAEYEDNSYSDITNAITSGKAVFLRKEDDTVPGNILYYPLSYIDDSNSTYYFSIVDDDTTNVAFVDSTSSWSYRSTDLQAKLISGTSIKTINNESLLGSGNINISSGGTVDQTYDPTSTNAQSGVAIAGAGFLTGITSSDIITALTYTPYDASNPDGFITSAALSGYATESWVGQQGFLTSSDLTNYVTTDTAQNITGVKTFVGQKMIAFKQSTSSNKLGFTLYNNNNVEKGYLEYNPSNTVDSAPLMTLGNYATAAAGITHVGFRKYSSVSGASGAYNLLAPLISNARTPFNLTTTYTNFYLPLGFTNGTTMVTTANTGVVDLSSLLPTVPTNISAFTNDSGYITIAALSGYATEAWVGQQGYITGITSNDIITALGYTPYNSTNPSGYQANVIETIKVNGTAQTVTSKTVDITVPSAVTESTVSGWGFTKNVGTVTSVNNVSPVNGNVSLTIPTVNNATITFTQGGVNKGTITLNQSTDQTIALDAGGSGGASALTDLSDVTLTSPSSGESLCYDGSKWVNAPKTLVTIKDWTVS